MIKAEINLDNELLAQLQSHLQYLSGNDNKLTPNTARAFDEAVRMIQRAWQNWANGGSLSGAANIKNPNPNLARSIRVDKRGSFSAEVYSESAQMNRIQNGQPAQDMKLTYPFGKKSRVSKKRIPYLIIPFRWGTPNKEGGARAHFGNAITPEMAKIIRAKNFAKSLRTDKTHTEDNAAGEPITRAEYNWGDRLEADGNMNGMVKMGSNAKQNTYFTFRVISMNSKPESWWKKAVPPNNVVSALKQNLEPEIEKLFDEGLKADLGE